jgi:hypothetical protein
VPRISLLTALFGFLLIQSAPATFDNSLVLAPLNIHVLDHSDEQYAHEAAELRARIGEAPYIKLGFAAFLSPQFADVQVEQPLTPAHMADALADIDTMVERARKNGLVAHVAIVSGFFHGTNRLRVNAARQDVRNAQWFADGSIAAPAAQGDPNNPPESIWATPSRKAELLRRRAEEGLRVIGKHLALRMSEHPDTLLTVSGDGEVELEAGWKPGLLADYSPFAVEEFRDWLRDKRYRGDLSPATDDNRDGHTLNKDFDRSFKTWRLRYYDASGPIPFAEYRGLQQKLPKSGRYFVDGGFDAPREENAKDAFWKAWMEFRTYLVANWVRDFTSWIRESGIPADRFFTHQIPAEFLFGGKDMSRLKLSASPTETAFAAPLGSTGVTTFNIFNGKTYSKTATPALYEAILKAGPNWGILEYNPSVLSYAALPPTSDERDLLADMLELYRYRPHILVPALWTDHPDHKTYTVQNSPFERALRLFVKEVGQTPWSPATPAH